MVNRKAFALAAALAFFIPLGVAGDPGDEVFSYAAHIVAELTDIDGIPIEINTNPGVAPLETEQLVEGHTTYVTMNVVKPPPPPQRELNVVGLVECRYEILGVDFPVPTHVDRVFLECNVGGSIFFTPSTSSMVASRDLLVPTGWERVVHTPKSRLPVLVTEYEYLSIERNEFGEIVERTSYAWETQIVPPETNPHTGKTYNFVGAINLERMYDLRLDRLQMYTAEELFGEKL